MKPGTKPADVVTLKLAWQMQLPEYECPEERWIRGWLNRASVDDVLTAIERIADRAQRGHIEHAEHAAKSVTAELNWRNARSA